MIVSAGRDLRELAWKTASEKQKAKARRLK
jgi:hypothetical protein